MNDTITKNLQYLHLTQYKNNKNVDLNQILTFPFNYGAAMMTLKMKRQLFL